MISQAQLERASAVYISLEGGLAFIPALSLARRVDLGLIPAQQRQEVCDAVCRAAQAAVQTGAAGAADQRFFRVEVRYEDTQADPVCFEVPEQQAPDGLFEIWRAATR